MTELKPCPFCGGNASHRHKDGAYGYYPGECYVACDSCEVSSPRFHDEKWTEKKGTFSVRAEAMKSAEEWWNRRHVPEAES